MTNQHTKVAFIFPGQGSQVIGMGQDVAETYPEAASIFAEADKILDFPLSTTCWQGPKTVLDDTFNTQPAVFVTALAYVAALQATGYKITPTFLAGHSLGEYVTYVVAGALSFADGLKLVRERARLMQKAGEENPGKMAAIIQLDDAQIAQICQQVSNETGWIEVANYNAPGQIIISGDVNGINRAVTLAKEAGARRAIPLAVSIAAHSKLLKVVEPEFIDAIAQVELKPPQYPIIANVTAKPIDTVEAIQTEMVNQLTKSVQWTQSVQFMIEEGVTKFVEIGPKKTLNSLIKRINGDVATTNIESIDSLNQFVAESNST